MTINTRSALARILPREGPMPFVVAQLGMSLDGRIATPTGDSRGLGGAASLDHLHALRARVDAVLIGMGTLRADDPQLTVRRCAGRSPARVVLDARGTLPPEARCLGGEDGARRLVLAGAGTPAPALPPGVERLELPAPQGRFCLRAAMAALAGQGFRTVLIEGGAGIVSAAIDAGVVDRLHLMISPVILGSGPSGLTLAPIGRIDQARRPVADVIPLGGGEVLYDCDLKS